MPNASSPASKPAGRFWRILPETALSAALDPVLSPEGRFHHSGQRTLYCSPSPEAAGQATARYWTPQDPPRVAIPLHLGRARLADLRDPAVLRALGLTGQEAAIPWLPERAAGQPATSWRASDAARSAGFDGMIYTARSAPARWHLALFRWNLADGPRLRRSGAPVPVTPPGLP